VSPLDVQVSEIHGLIDELRRRRSSTLTDRARATRPSAAPPARRSSRPRSAMPAIPAPPSQRDSGAAPLEARLVPVCERLERALDKIEARLGAAPSAPAGELPPLSPDCAMRGRIRESLLPDLLQMVTSNRWTGVFVATHGAVECRLYFDDGQACHAEAPGETGEGAFFAALALEQGEYSFIERPPPDERTINSNTQFLILEALRQIDEKKGG
jgi:hypothetical protein